MLIGIAVSNFVDGNQCTHFTRFKLLELEGCFCDCLLILGCTTAGVKIGKVSFLSEYET